MKIYCAEYYMIKIQENEIIQDTVEENENAIVEEY